MMERTIRDLGETELIVEALRKAHNDGFRVREITVLIGSDLVGLEAGIVGKVFGVFAKIIPGDKLAIITKRYGI